MAKADRNIMPTHDAKIRAKNFEEVASGFDLELAINEAQRCLNCKNAPCKQGCPVNVPIPEFITMLKQGDVAAAAEIIKGTNNLPSVCGRVCPQEEQCEKLCVRQRAGGAVAIGALERFAGDYALQNAPKPTVQQTKKGRVAVIGGGPASLTAAADCAKAGMSVTVFEAFHTLGGVLVYGIPEFRLPKKIVDAEIQNLLALGVKIELNTVVGKTLTLDQILSEFDFAFIGSGAGLPVFLGIEGENLNGVYSANEYLTRINLMKAYKDDAATPVLRGDNVAVFGAGNVAMDAARTALRLGAKSVKIVYRRSQEQMPARNEEIEHAVEEGVELLTLAAPIQFCGQNGRINKVICQRMRLGQPDQSGRCSPVAIENSQFEFDCDLAIIAVGTSPNPLLKDSCPQLKTSPKGTLIIDETGATSVDRVYAGGDAVTGAATVILAMGAGKRAAKSIIQRWQELQQ